MANTGVVAALRAALAAENAAIFGYGVAGAHLTGSRQAAAERASAANLVRRLATAPPALAQLLASIAASDATHVTALGG